MDEEEDYELVEEPEPVSDAERAVPLANEAADIIFEITAIAENSAGSECSAIVEIREKLDRVWEIIGDLGRMELTDDMNSSVLEATAPGLVHLAAPSDTTHRVSRRTSGGTSRGGDVL